MKGKHETRVLGRVLAVEETTHVSGAKPTTPCLDNITAPSSGDTSTRADCTQSVSDSGTVIDSTGPTLDPLG